MVPYELFPPWQSSNYETLNEGLDKSKRAEREMK